MRLAYLAILMLSSATLAQQAVPSQPGEGVALPALVTATDPLSRQNLTFDASFAKLTLHYLQTRDANDLKRLEESPATAHLLDHARNFDYDVPKDSAPSLVAHLMSKANPERTANCRDALAYFTDRMLPDPHWVDDTLRYLPEDFRFEGSLFLVFGYDIGVAYGHNASLNCAHPHFTAHPDELKYYAIHELHHVGFMSYHPPPRLTDIKTCRDLLRLVQYSTQLEGMAVYAAYDPRKRARALNDDEDYVALQNEARMRSEERLYFEDLHYLEQRGDEPADDTAWAVITRMSSGERLWYRVGARMAQRVEEESGRPALIALIPQGPQAFLAAYERLLNPPAATVPQPQSPPRLRE